MIRIFYFNQNKLLCEKITGGLDVFDPKDDIIWIDLQFPSNEERLWCEKNFEIKFSTKQEAEEIEISSRYIEIANEIRINSNFLVDEDQTLNNKAVSFVLKNEILFSYRDADLKSFADTVKKLKLIGQPLRTGISILLLIFETRIDSDADFIENTTKLTTEVSRKIDLKRNIDVDLLLQINDIQEITLMLRENLVDKQRVLSNMLRSNFIPTEYMNRMRILIKDINSLIEHTNFGFERLEYLQNTFLGLVNIEQNKIIKIFTVASVIFMPPTLIASIYGMNFDFMSIYQHKMGLPFALLLMLLSSFITLFFFKRRKWL